jgi:hypothetical protein
MSLSISQESPAPITLKLDDKDQPWPPILLAEISHGIFSVIDANHRVAEARRDAMPTLPSRGSANFPKRLLWRRIFIYAHQLPIFEVTHARME